MPINSAAMTAMKSKSKLSCFLQRARKYVTVWSWRSCTSDELINIMVAIFSEGLVESTIYKMYLALTRLQRSAYLWRDCRELCLPLTRLQRAVLTSASLQRTVLTSDELAERGELERWTDDAGNFEFLLTLAVDVLELFLARFDAHRKHVCGTKVDTLTFKSVTDNSPVRLNDA